MKIFEVKPDTSYRFMYPEDDVYNSDDWSFSGKPLINKWPKLFHASFDEESTEPLTDIAYIGMMSFAFRDDVATKLVDILEAAGEVIPFYVDNQVWYVLNVLEFASDAVISPGEEFTQIGIKFDVDKLPKSSLFKIAQDNYTKIYCADKRDSDDDVLNNFLCAVAGYAFTGIRFKEVFDSDV